MLCAINLHTPQMAKPNRYGMDNAHYRLPLRLASIRYPQYFFLCCRLFHSPHLVCQNCATRQTGEQGRSSAFCAYTLSHTHSFRLNGICSSEFALVQGRLVIGTSLPTDTAKGISSREQISRLKLSVPFDKSQNKS